MDLVWLILSGENTIFYYGIKISSWIYKFNFYSYAPKLPVAGETVLGTKFQTGFGGKGANQCAAAAKLGGKTAFIARV